MSFSQGDVVWLRIDKLEGGIGQRHPAVVLSADTFNDSHDWGYIVRGSHMIPAILLPEEYIIHRDGENRLDQDTVFGSILQSAKWSRMTTLGGKVPPVHLRELMARVTMVLGL